jgi:protein TonB
VPFADMSRTPPADSVEATLTPGWLLIRRWLSDIENKKLDRPLAIATTVELSFRPPDARLRPEDWKHIRYAGPVYYFLPGPGTQESPDTSRLRINLQRVPMAAFRGAWVDERDTSPVHHLGTPFLKTNIATAGLMYAASFTERGQEASLREAIDWLKRYASESGLDVQPGLYDSVFLRLKAKMGSGGPRAEASIPAPKMSSELNPADPKPGEYIFVEELPEAITRVTPSYPEEARQKGIQGTVVVQALVGKFGVVSNTFIVSSVPGLDQAAQEAVLQWTFKPARAKGKNIAVWVAVPVRFSLH